MKSGDITGITGVPELTWCYNCNTTYGIVIEEKDYHSTIIKSLPPHLSAFASNLLAGMRL